MQRLIRCIKVPFGGLGAGIYLTIKVSEVKIVS